MDRRRRPCPTPGSPARSTSRARPAGSASRSCPGSGPSVDLSSLPADYDVALYGDIQAAFDRLSASSDITQLAAASAAGAPGSETQVPTYPAEVTQVPTSAAELPSTQFAPRIYAPRIYAPRIYAPRIYAPRIYAPRIYAPRIYAPDSYNPDLDADPAFRDAFSAAQNQTLLAVSANTGIEAETRLRRDRQHGRLLLRPGAGPRRRRVRRRPAVPARACGLGRHRLRRPRGLRRPAHAGAHPRRRAHGHRHRHQQARARRGHAGARRLPGLAGQPGGQHRRRGRRRAAARRGCGDLQDQVAGHPDCPYAVNLVARAVKEIVDSYRNADSTYVVIAGGDEVIPFFRYPDVSGLGQESQFEPPVLPDSPSGASLVPGPGAEPGRLRLVHRGDHRRGDACRCRTCPSGGW